MTDDVSQGRVGYTSSSPSSPSLNYRYFHIRKLLERYVTILKLSFKEN